MCNLLGRPLGKRQHDGARNGSPVAALAEIAQAFLGETHLPHSRVHERRETRLLQLGPGPVRDPRDGLPVRRVSSVNRPSELEHASGAVGQAVKVETVGELLRASLVEHPGIEPGKAERNCADFAPDSEFTYAHPGAGVCPHQRAGQGVEAPPRRFGRLDGPQERRLHLTAPAPVILA